MTALMLRGRPSLAQVAQLRDDALTASEELAQHHVEALAFVDACWPLVDALEDVARRFLGPREHQLTLRLGRALAGYETRHLPSPDEPTEMAVAA